MTALDMPGVCVDAIPGWGWCSVTAGANGLLAASGGLSTEADCRRELGDAIPRDWIPDSAAATGGLAYLHAALTGDPPEIPEIDLRGTTFENNVWRALGRVPRGTTTTYSDIAAGLGLSARHARAVGRAVGANPLWVIVPCHRVIGQDGSLTGYAGGLDLKRKLLNAEASALIGASPQ